MASAKGPTGKIGSVTSMLTIGTAVVGFLTRPEVKKVLGDASSSAKAWAAGIKNRRTDTRPSAEGGRVRGIVKDRYGAGALLRRLDALAAAITTLAELDESVSHELSVREQALRARVNAAAKLSPELRRPKLKALEAELDEFERALADAIG
jgi:hypothetical protein